MSDLLNKASLVMIPSGYKEDTVYSQLPQDGSGDLSFTRASNGTRINSQGLVEVCPWNLLQYSEDITNAAWGEFGATRSANTATAPNGTTTADTILPSATTSTHGIFQQITVSGGIYSASAYFKANGYNYACIRIATNSDTTRYGVVISLIDGSVTATDTSGSPTNTSYSIETASNGWFKLNVSCSHSSGFIYHTVGVSNVAVPTFANSLPSFTANGTSSIFIWGAQLNIGATAKPYFPTTDRLNVPRLTYQNGGGGCPSLLLEPQRTNLLTYSEQLDNVAWSRLNSSVTANSTTSPDGTTNADKIVEDTANSGHTIYQYYSSTSGTVYTFSVFAKASERTKLWMDFFGGGSVGVFDLSNGTVITTSGAGITARIENFGNGWYRCSISQVAAGTDLYPNFGPTINNTTSPTYQGNGTSGIFVYGVQLEASSYPTSYIPSTSSSATRVADACFKTGISSLIGQTEGVLFAEVQGFSNDTVRFAISDGTNNNNIYIELSASNISAVGRVGAVNQFSIISSQTLTNVNKIAIKYKTNDFALWINGMQVGTDTSGSTYSTSTLNSLRFDRGDGGIPFYGNVKQTILFPNALTNAELASLTTI